MSEFRVGQEIPDHATGKTPRGTLLRHRGLGYLEIVELPIEPPKVGDVIDTEAQAKLLPVGSVLVDGNDDPESRPITKVGDDRWMYYYRGPVFDEDSLFAEKSHRVLYVPDADAGTGRTAA